MHSLVCGSPPVVSLFYVTTVSTAVNRLGYTSMIMEAESWKKMTSIITASLEYRSGNAHDLVVRCDENMWLIAMCHCSIEPAVTHSSEETKYLVEKTVEF